MTEKSVTDISRHMILISVQQTIKCLYFPQKMKCPSQRDRARSDPFIMKFMFACISVSSLFISNLFQIGT